MAEDGKLLTAALVAGPRRSRAQRVLDALGRQTARDAIEIAVIDAGPADAPPLRPPEGVACDYLRRPGERSWTRLRYELVHLTWAPVFALIEDHCYPLPGWAEALIERHREPWAAVAYAFTNANPVNYVARASMVCDYGLWMHPVKDTRPRVLPGNNVSYKRETLLSFGDAIATLLSPDFALQEKLRQMGAPMCVEPRALAAHENFESLTDLLGANHNYSRAVGARRALTQGWGRPRRWFYGLATPIGSPLIRMLRLFVSLRGRSSITRQVLAAFPVYALAYSWSAIGEAAGYLFGEKRADDDLFECELARVRRLDSRDR